MASPSATARSLAWRVLQRVDHEGAYANLALRAELDRCRLDERDRHFATDLVYGTTRMRRACDALVDRFVVREPDPSLRSLLRLGAYQLAFLGTAPHAAVSATVDLAPRRSRGFVNVVLRRVADTPMVWPDEATRLSYPDWIVERLTGEVGHADAVAALERMNQPAPVSTRDDGYVQDLASQWVAALAAPEQGQLVFDACAGPGGKATALAAHGGVVVAADVRLARAGLVASNAARLGADVMTLVTDATAPSVLPGSFARVLVDAPCSGLGALRRRADARWRVQADDVAPLAALQRRILEATAPLVAADGMLVYSVCTLTAEESVEHPVPEGFELVDDDPGAPWRRFGSGWIVLPHDADTDGMVLVRYRRRT